MLSRVRLQFQITQKIAHYRLPSFTTTQTFRNFNFRKLEFINSYNIRLRFLTGDSNITGEVKTHENVKKKSTMTDQNETF